MREWPGRVLHPALPAGRSGARISVGGDALIALLPNGSELRLSFADARLALQGYAGKSCAFSSRSESRFTVIVDKIEFLEALRALRIPEFEVEWERFRKGRRKAFARKILLPLALLVLVVAATPFVLRSVLVELGVKAIPKGVDVELGKQGLGPAMKEISGGTAEITDPEVRTGVVRILERLLPAAAGKGFRFEVHVVPAKLVNAFALPGGQIVLTTGLLRTAESPEEVAGVLAHEIAHVTERHGLKRIVSQLSLWLILAAVFGDVGTVTGVILAQAAELVSLGYSRDMEREADQEGIRILHRARVAAQGLRRFLERLKKERGASEFLTRFLSTHPVTDERLRTIDELVGKSGTWESTPIAVDWIALRRRLSLIPK